MPAPTPVFFNELQLEFKPLYEWALGEKISHPETTARAESILVALERDPSAFEVREPPPVPDSALRALHDHNLITLYETAAKLPDDKTFHPNVFPRKKRGLGDPTNLNHAGAWCFDSGTPLSSRTLEAARWSAACARAAARTVIEGAPLAYALSRPPGHHAMRDLYGGYCYFNNTALAARTLRRRGRVVVIDIDFHHGNGTQELFWRDGKVLTVSLHGHPDEFFPYFLGYPDERGAGAGAGANHNLCLPRGCDGATWLEAMETHVLPLVRNFGAEALVVAAGLDGYVKDPVGDWALQTVDFHEAGLRLGRLGLPTVVVQEGGYYTPHLGRNAAALLRGVRSGLGIA
jgi:acetoin utilization deacetylase AcuC-like enzyme